MTDWETLELPEVEDLFEPMFEDVVTFDPSQVEEKWDLLSQETLSLQLGSLGQIVMLAFLHTLKETPLLNSRRQSKKQPDKAERDGG